MLSKWVYPCLATLVFCGVTVNWLPGCAVMVSSWQMLRKDRSPPVVLELVSRRWLKYIYSYFVVYLESPGLNIVIAY